MAKSKYAMRKKNKPKEHEEQVALFKWARLQEKKFPELACLYAIPNAGKRSIAAAKYMKAEGLKSGVSDVHLPVSKGCFIGLWIEMKVDSNKPTENQWDWINKMQHAAHHVAVCYSFEEAKCVIEWYLNLKAIGAIKEGINEKG